MGKAYLNGGVSIDPVLPSTGKMVEIQYNGLLAKSGADRVWLQIGYGAPDKWFGVKALEMQNRNNDFIARFKMEYSDNLHFCFKDSANNWDNNGGRNWNTAVDGDNLSYG